ncbi:protein of unknown function [Rhizobiales bacterium GAS188]|nr:protein of unknown function [Rhizobiales bacterium GAS188]
MAISQALQEAYASVTHDAVIYHTLAINHPTFSAPVYVIDGVEADMSLPLESGGSVTFIATAFMVTPPGVNDSGPQPAKIRVDNVAGLLAPYLESAVLSGSPITVTYRAYTTKDLSGPGDVIPGLILRKVTLMPSAAEGELRWEEIDLAAFPRLTYDQTLYPAIHSGWF